jgi:hypothetical protein
MEKKLMSPWHASSFSSAMTVFGQADTTRLWFGCIYRAHFFPLFIPSPSLPPYLDAIWKQAIQRYPPWYGNDISEMVVERLLGTLSSTPGSVGCVPWHGGTAARRAKGGEAGQIGRSDNNV